ncbi:MAG: 16S rRNA (cytosine(1402)-N(4))-methyltransferase RsmH [Acidiferrobacterales bacterium]
MSDASERGHVAVLLDEVLLALRLQSDGIYIDATYGRGGHAAVIVRRLGAHGHLLVFDRDPEAVAEAKAHFGNDARVTIINTRFSTLGQHVDDRALAGRVNGILFDLGVSSPQLESSERGFSFQRDSPLDMRMDSGSGVTAAEWLRQASEREITSVLSEFGEERYAKRIARAVVNARRQRPISRSEQLAQLVAGAVPTREPGKHPATRTFLALRVFLNQELEELAGALPQALRALATGGRLAVISFHSLEDRLVKRFMREQAGTATLPPKLPVPAQPGEPALKLLRKIRPSATEIRRNPRARSAILRVAERTGVDRA